MECPTLYRKDFIFTWGKLFAEATPRLVTSLYNLYETKVQYEPDRTDMY
jgi:hypothetical protein